MSGGTVRSTADARAITAVPVVADSTARAAQADPDPDLAYGPDDPGYGPPGPDWYQRDPEEPVAAEPASTPVPAAATAVPIRSPFEPLVRSPLEPLVRSPLEPLVRSPFEPLARSSTGSWSTAAGPTSADLADDGHPVTESGAPESGATEHAEHADDERSSYPSAGYENPGIDDFDLPGSAPDDALGQLRHLYASAERMGAETTDAGGTESQLGQLLDKQRKLISEYFKESGSLPEGTTEISDLRGAR